MRVPLIATIGILACAWCAEAGEKPTAEVQPQTGAADSLKSNITRAPSPTNPWLGAQVGLRIAGSGDFADRVGGTAVVRLQTWAIDSVHIPLFCNISNLSTPEAGKEWRSVLENLVLPSEGIYIRLTPYLDVGKDASRMRFNFWASLGWHLTAAKDSLNHATDLNEARFGLGGEVRTPSVPLGSRPTTFSLEPVWHLADAAAMEKAVGRRLRSFGSLEITSIVALSESDLGLLAEVIVSTDRVPTVWRVGLVFMEAAKTTK